MKLKLNSLDYKEAKGALKVARDHIGDLQQFNVKLRGIIDDVLTKKEIRTDVITKAYKDAEEWLRQQNSKNAVPQGCRSIEVVWDDYALTEIRVIEANKIALRLQNELAADDHEESVVESERSWRRSL